MQPFLKQLVCEHANGLYQDWTPHSWGSERLGTRRELIFFELVLDDNISVFRMKKHANALTSTGKLHYILQCTTTPLGSMFLHMYMCIHNVQGRVVCCVSAGIAYGMVKGLRATYTDNYSYPRVKEVQYANLREQNRY